MDVIQALMQKWKLNTPTPLPAYQAFPYVWSVYCLNSVNTLFPNAPGNCALCPPFFKAKELPASKNRIREAVTYHAPVMLYNTLLFEGAPKNEQLFKALELFERALSELTTTNPWVFHLDSAGKSGVKVGDYISGLPEEIKVELNLARPTYEDTVTPHVEIISNWYNEYWEAHKRWAAEL